MHLIEPQWNPAVEAQAIGRAMRLGQERQVTVVRYIIRNSIEESIRSRQKRKLHLVELTGLGEQADDQDAVMERLNVGGASFPILGTDQLTDVRTCVLFYEAIPK